MTNSREKIVIRGAVFVLGIIACFFFAAGCESLNGCRMKKNVGISKAQAINIAKARFGDVKIGQLDQYDITVRDDLRSNKWSVCFDARAEYARPGNHAVIHVDKDTGQTIVATGE